MTEQTPEPTTLQATLAAVEDLAGRVTTLTAEVVRLRSYGRRNRAFIVIDIVLTIRFAFATYVAVDASAAASRNGVTIAQLHQAQLAGCVAGNQTREQEIALWTHLAKIASPSPHLTKAQIAANKHEVAQLLAYIRMTFAARDCKSLYKIDGGSS